MNELTICCAANDEHVLAANLAQSPVIRSGLVDLIIERGHGSAGSAYNAAIAKASSDVVVCTHQDVYLPAGWEQRLLDAIKDLELRGERWAVLGVWGIQADGAFAGRVWCSGGNREYVRPFAGQAVEVDSIDEIVIVINRKVGLRFDDALPGFHLYGTDIILQAQQIGHRAFVFDGPVVHNSRCNPQPLDRAFWNAYRYMQRKWASQVPLRTCTVPVTRAAWPLRKAWLRNELDRLRGRTRDDGGRRGNDAVQLAQRLGYETTTTREPALAGQSQHGW